MQRLPDVVTTPRLTLRRWEPADAPAMAAAIAESDAHLRPWMPWMVDEPLPMASRLAVIEQFTRGWEVGGDAVYGAFIDRRDVDGDDDRLGAAGTVVGGCGLHRRRGPTVLEVGYWVRVGSTGRGFATEMASALTSVALAQPGIERVEIHHDQANATSRRVPEGLGFTLVGERPDRVDAPGEVGIDCTWATSESPAGRSVDRR